MNKTMYAVILSSLLLFSFFVSSTTAEDVLITIKGGLSCTVTVQNNENHTIIADISIVSQSLLGSGFTNSTGGGPIEPGHSVLMKSSPPGIQKITATAKTSDQTVVRKGISFFHFVLMFKA